MPSNGLSIKEHEFEEHVMVDITGEIDIYTCQQLKESLYKIADTYCKNLILDCSGLSYIDSTGLGVFVAVLKKEKMIGCDIKIINLKDSILKLFLITNLDSLFNIEHDADGVF